jgi:hypothetical protein
MLRAAVMTRSLRWCRVSQITSPLSQPIAHCDRGPKPWGQKWLDQAGSCNGSHDSIGTLAASRAPTRWLRGGEGPAGGCL